MLVMAQASTFLHLFHSMLRIIGGIIPAYTLTFECACGLGSQRGKGFTHNGRHRYYVWEEYSPSQAGSLP